MGVFAFQIKSFIQEMLKESAVMRAIQCPGGVFNATRAIRDDVPWKFPISSLQDSDEFETFLDSRISDIQRSKLVKHLRVYNKKRLRNENICLKNESICLKLF